MRTTILYIFALLLAFSVSNAFVIKATNANTFGLAIHETSKVLPFRIASDSVANNNESEGINEKIPTQLSEAFHKFFLSRYNGPRLMVGIQCGLVLHRMSVMTTHPLGIADAACGILAASFWWISEHPIQKFLFHSSFDWFGKRYHEHHHNQCYHHIALDPAGAVVVGFALIHTLLRSFLPLSWALSASLGYTTAALGYEFFHFVSHTKVRFRRDSYLQRIKAHHIRHHQVDDRYWLGVSVPAIDTILGTNPSVKEVRKQDKQS